MSPRGRFLCLFGPFQSFDNLMSWTGDWISTDWSLSDDVVSYTVCMSLSGFSLSNSRSLSRESCSVHCRWLLVSSVVSTVPSMVLVVVPVWSLFVSVSGLSVLVDLGLISSARISLKASEKYEPN